MMSLCNIYRNVMRLRIKAFSAKLISTNSTKYPEYDLNYLCNESNSKDIEENIKIRKGVGNIHKLISVYHELSIAKKNNDTSKINSLETKLHEEAKLIPNKTHDLVKSYGQEPKIVKYINTKPSFEKSEPLELADIARRLNIMRTDHLGNVTGHRSYYFMSDLAELEEALIKYSISQLLKKGFQLVSVPDILPSHIIESCGMNVTSERTQIYSLDSSHHGPELCLSGTAEMSLAGLLMHTTLLEKDLPLKLAAVSRCYRAETSNIHEQKGIFRVHQFNKVEMFSVASPESSEALLEEFRSIEEENFANLGLHMRVLDMPPHELGAPAFRKYDIEAWLPGRKMYGEISSCSNCTDYQSRRLGIKYTPEGQSTAIHAHTLNGTACAIPRMLIAILETYQQSNGKIVIPQALRKYMGEREYIEKKKAVPDLKLIKIKVYCCLLFIN